jgi:hypothetical protein
VWGPKVEEVIVAAVQEQAHKAHAAVSPEHKDGRR